MGRALLTTDPDRVALAGARNIVEAPGDTLSAGDVIVGAPASDTTLVLEDGNRFDLSAPLILEGISQVVDRSVGNSIVALRDGLDLTVQLGRDNATVIGADNADTIIGGEGGFATIVLGSAQESVVAGGSGARVAMRAGDAGARIEGGGVTVVTLTGAAGAAVALGGEVQGVSELDILSPDLAVTLHGAGVAGVGLSGSGISVGLDASVTLVTDYAGGNTVCFSGPGQTLRLPYAGTDPGLAPDRVAGFGPGDAIDVDLPYGATETLSYDLSTGRLILSDPRSGAAVTVFVPPAAGVAGFRMAADGGMPSGDTGTLITLLEPLPPDPGEAPCFAAGTRVLTPAGQVAVEALGVGDRVITASGEARAICWVGWRKLECRRHPRPERVLPIRVCAGAFGAGAPGRDVVLSPDHAVFVDGVLIPVKHLLNGASVRREDVAAVHYIHLELAEHDVVLAEGLAVETYLDTGNRHHFANGGGRIALHPDFAGADGRACAPLAESGAAVWAVRARLLERAEALGFRTTAEPDLHVRADGQRIWGRRSAAGWSGWIPPGVRDVRVVSRASAPADCVADSEDRRRLGVALRGVTVSAEGRAVRLDADGDHWGAGFHLAESDAWGRWRWTDGDGCLRPSLWQGLSGPLRLDLHVFGTVTYRLGGEEPGVAAGARSAMPG